jgi:PAS domain S-box-containing protein
MSGDERNARDSVRILVVEDSPTQAQQLAYVLDGRGYGVEIARDGVAALESLARLKPALVLTDVVMPEMDGYELCRRIKANPALQDLPVILVTSLSDPGDVVRGLECGADNFIVKPYHEEELLSRIEYILANQRLGQNERAEMGVEIVFAGRRHFIKSGRLQILNLLLTTYDTAVRKNLELQHTRDELAELNGLLEEKVHERTAELEAEIRIRERTEGVLAQSEQRYRHLYERNVAGLFRTSVEGEILECNEAFAHILGYEGRAPVIGLDVRELYFDPAERCRVVEKVRAEGQLRDIEVCLRRQDGSQVWILENLTLVESDLPGGQVLEGALIDMTERKKLEEQLRQAQKMESIGRLAGGVAHDFNNVLQALLSITQVLRAHRSDPERFTTSLEELEQHVRRGAALTRQLLLFARREVSKTERLDLNHVVQEAAGLLRRLVRENVTFSVETSDEPLRVDADHNQLDQVLMNLIVNACDAMPGGGDLAVRTGRLSDTEAYVEVRDSGVGMSEELQERIFDPFFTTKVSGQGTGLGLAVVHGIVVQHGGRIDVTSRAGTGTVFRIVLPRRDSGEYPAVRGELLEPAQLPHGRGERILLVEDEEGARAGLREILTMLGYEVVAAGSGEEVDLLSMDQKFDLLLTDLVLPGVHGPDLARRLKERWPELKVVLMSGYAEDEALRRSVNQGIAHFLQKPFDMETLAVELRAVLDAKGPE